MHISETDIKAGEMIFDAAVGDYDSKHINNLADKEVSEEILRQIEAGCPLETLDELAKKYPICKYRTQITIHGKFPELMTRRVGGKCGYVNLCRNQNGSIGVRWDAIDNAKKSKLFRTVAICKGWNVIHNSTYFGLRHIKFLNDENKAAVIADFKAEAERIEKGNHLFFGGANVMVCAVPFFGLVAVLQVNVKAFYETNYQAVLECITGMSGEEIVAKVAEYEAEKKRKQEEDEKRHAEYVAETEKREAEIKAYNDKWLIDNPSPFPKSEGHSLAVGDIIAKAAHKSAYGDKRYDHWNFYIIGKSFGRLIMTPCDEKGNKERFVRGREVRTAVGNFYVKPTAKPSALPCEPLNTVSQSSAATTCTVTENVAKGGLEIRFNSKPSEAVIASLKAEGYRWSKFGRCWWIKKSDRAVEFANSLAGKFAA